jgi:hypothetical protein
MVDFANSCHAAGEDIIYLIPNRSATSSSSSTEAICLTASLNNASIPMPRIHRHFYNSALTAAQGSLYMLGGSQLGFAAPPVTPSQLEVFDPHINSWFSSGAPLPGRVQLTGEGQLDRGLL